MAAVKMFELDGVQYPVSFSLNTLAIYEEVSGLSGGDALKDLTKFSVIKHLVYSIFKAGAIRAKQEFTLSPDELLGMFSVGGEEVQALFDLLADEMDAKKKA